MNPVFTEWIVLVWSIKYVVTNNEGVYVQLIRPRSRMEIYTSIPEKPTYEKRQKSQKFTEESF